MSPETFSEDELVERPTVELLAELGWQTINAYTERMGPGGTLGRDSRRDVVLTHRLLASLRVLNVDALDAALEEAVVTLSRDRSLMDPARGRTPRSTSSCATASSPPGATTTARAGRADPIRRLAQHGPERLAGGLQVWVAGDLHGRRADSSSSSTASRSCSRVEGAQERSSTRTTSNLRDYRDTIPQLFTPNAFVILSNGSETKVGATFAPWERFGEWKRIDDEAEPGVVSLETTIRGMCEPDRLLDLVENFVAYLERPGGLVKVLAQNHQVLGVNAAIERCVERRPAKARLGVFWHTQGIGQEPLDALLHPEGAAHGSPATGPS